MAEGTAGAEWSVREIDLILADYFDMLSLELAGRPYTKSERNTALQKLIGRSRGSIEYKHQNISAALMHLGLPWIRGYKPMANFQHALIDGIARHYGDLEARVDAQVPTPERQGFAEDRPIFLEPPPLLVEDERIPEAMRRLVRKFDPAERDARNRRLGRSGEERIFFNERAMLKAPAATTLPARSDGFRRRMATEPTTTSSPSIRTAWSAWSRSRRRPGTTGRRSIFRATSMRFRKNGRTPSAWCGSTISRESRAPLN